MLSRSSIPQADLHINVGEGQLHAGSTIEVEVIVTPQRSFHAHSGEIELVRTDTYWFHKPHNVAIGHLGPALPIDILRFLLFPLLILVSYLLYKAKLSQTTETEKEEVIFHRESFLSEAELSSGISFRRLIRFSLPSDATPSVEGNTLLNPARSRGDCSPQITWRVRARLYFLQTRRGRVWRRRESDPTLLRQKGRTLTVVAPPTESRLRRSYLI